MDLWDVFNHYEATRANRKSDETSLKLETAKSNIGDEISRVHERVDHLALLCRAMFELLQERTDIKDADLAKKMEEIDLRDGRRDGKMGSAITKCPDCGRTVSPKFRKCLYCGRAVEGADDPFNIIK